jgi:hypothetical protein
MQQVEVDRIDAQALERSLAGAHELRARGVVGIELAHDEHLVAPPVDGFGDYLLGAALAVHLRGVDERHAEVDAELEGRDFIGARGRVFAHAPGAEAQPRNRAARRETGIRRAASADGHAPGQLADGNLGDDALAPRVDHGDGAGPPVGHVELRARRA